MASASDTQRLSGRFLAAGRRQRTARNPREDCMGRPSRPAAESPIWIMAIVRPAKAPAKASTRSAGEFFWQHTFRADSLASAPELIRKQCLILDRFPTAFARAAISASSIADGVELEVALHHRVHRATPQGRRDQVRVAVAEHVHADAVDEVPLHRAVGKLDEGAVADTGADVWSTAAGLPLVTRPGVSRYCVVGLGELRRWAGRAAVIVDLRLGRAHG